MVILCRNGKSRVLPPSYYINLFNRFLRFKPTKNYNSTNNRSYYFASVVIMTSQLLSDNCQVNYYDWK